ncbi:MAG: DUF1232 domain-containing protein [Bacteroidetes bacterium]|nr:DUF1232 domain-containing protein [Bacteroidota bacterium]
MAFRKRKKADLKKVDEASFNEEITYIEEKDVEIVFENEDKIHRKFQKKAPLKKYLNFGKTIFQMLKDYKNGTYREVPWSTIASIILVLLYVLNPFDIIPDFLVGFGYLDDAGVLAMAMNLIKTDYENYVAWRALQSTKT